MSLGYEQRRVRKNDHSLDIRFDFLRTCTNAIQPSNLCTFQTIFFTLNSIRIHQVRNIVLFIRNRTPFSWHFTETAYFHDHGHSVLNIAKDWIELLSLHWKKPKQIEILALSNTCQQHWDLRCRCIDMSSLWILDVLFLILRKIRACWIFKWKYFILYMQ